jgi:YfiH family protein
MTEPLIFPSWPAPARVRGFVTTRTSGDGASRLPNQPVSLRQVHGSTVANLDEVRETVAADAAVARAPGVVCAVKVADCMPLLFTDDRASVVGVAHAGWRGLAAGVLENTIEKLNSRNLLAWMGPAIGPRVYEVGEDVYRAFPGHESAFKANRPGHWLMDLYAIARHKLQAAGVRHIYGGGFCTYSDPQRFFSYRRDGSTGRMLAYIWLAAE